MRSSHRAQSVERLKNMRELQVSTRAGALTTQRVHSVSLLKSDCLNNGCLVVVWIFERLIGTRGYRGIVHSHLIQFLASPHGSSRFSFLPLIYHARGPAGFALSPFPVFRILVLIAVCLSVLRLLKCYWLGTSCGIA
jgi:hypothetical protein